MGPFSLTGQPNVWLIEDVQTKHPEILFLAEAFTRPKLMYALAKRGYDYPASQTPWQQIQREMVAQFDEGMVLKPAVQYQRLAQTAGTPRDNH